MGMVEVPTLLSSVGRPGATRLADAMQEETPGLPQSALSTALNSQNQTPGEAAGRPCASALLVGAELHDLHGIGGTEPACSCGLYEER
eukprot:744353-Amphidinium_carterae.1